MWKFLTHRHSHPVRLLSMSDRLVTQQPQERRTALFWAVTQRVVAVSYRRFRGNLSVPSSRAIGCPETALRNCNYTLRNCPEERSSHVLVHRVGGLKNSLTTTIERPQTYALDHTGNRIGSILIRVYLNDVAHPSIHSTNLHPDNTIIIVICI